MSPIPKAGPSECENHGLYERWSIGVSLCFPVVQCKMAAHLNKTITPTQTPVCPSADAPFLSGSQPRPSFCPNETSVPTKGVNQIPDAQGPYEPSFDLHEETLLLEKKKWCLKRLERKKKNSKKKHTYYEI